MLETTTSLENIKAKDILTSNPKTVLPDELAVNALEILRSNDISQLVVINKHDKYMGMLHLHDIVKEGIV
jgi:arabinose-5-phosphate isomerase